MGEPVFRHFLGVLLEEESKIRGAAVWKGQVF